MSPTNQLQNISGPLGPYTRGCRVVNASKGFDDPNGFLFEVAGGIDKAERIEIVALGSDASIRVELGPGEAPRCAGLPIICVRVFPHKDLRIMLGYL